MKKFVIGSSVFAMPFLAFAQVTDVTSLINLVGGLLNQIVPLIFALAFVYLIWNIVKYIEAGQGDPKTRDIARDAIIFALVLLFVMSSVWGLVGIIKNTLNVQDNTITPPQPFSDV